MEIRQLNFNFNKYYGVFQVQITELHTISTKYNLLHHKDGMLISHSSDTLKHAELV